MGDGGGAPFAPNPLPQVPSAPRILKLEVNHRKQKRGFRGRLCWPSPGTSPGRQRAVYTTATGRVPMTVDTTFNGCTGLGPLRSKIHATVAHAMMEVGVVRVAFMPRQINRFLHDVLLVRHACLAARNDSPSASAAPSCASGSFSAGLNCLVSSRGPLTRCEQTVLERPNL